MCRRERNAVPLRPLLAVSLALVAVVQPVAAQDARLSEDERARLEREMEALEARMVEVRTLEARLAEAGRRQVGAALRRIEEGSETETIGPIVVRRPSGTAPVSALVRDVLAEFEPTLGDLGRVATLRVNLYDPADVGAAARSGPGDGGAVWFRHTEAGLARLGRQVRAHVLSSIPDPIGLWSGGMGWTDDPATLDALREMARVTDRDGVRCLQDGDIASCGRFLFVEDDGSTEARYRAFDRYYATRDLAMLRRLQGREGDRGWEALGRCVSRDRRIGIPLPRAGCLERLARSGARASFMAAPVARGSVVAFALRSGGPGALDRLRARPTGVTVAEQLEAVSGMPIDDLLAAWRGDAVNGSGMFENVGGHPPGPVSLLWAGGLALLALRSTRWRLG